MYSDALCERELDLEMADALPPRDTLTIAVPPIHVVVIEPTVVVQTGVATAVSVGGGALAMVHNLLGS